MTTVITNLYDKLIKEIRNANEIWVAVALINLDGLNMIIDNLKSTCCQNFLLGIDLPTDPRALKKINELQLISNTKVRIYTEKEFYHPKIYLIKKGNRFSAFVGSSNCTAGGLYKNIELSIYINEQNTCKQLKEWFDEYFSAGKPLSQLFIDNYQVDYTNRLKRKKQDENTIKQGKLLLNKEFEAFLSEKSEFLKVLRKYRKGKEYKGIVRERGQTVKKIKTSLDYPKFNRVDIDDFFSILELGHIIEISKPQVKRQIVRFKRLLNWLCNENIDIVTRYDKALNKFKVGGVSDAFISKILVAHRPDLYYVKNKKSTLALRKYGIELPNGISKGYKYKITCETLRKICKDSGIKDLSVLDRYLYKEVSKEA